MVRRRGVLRSAAGAAALAGCLTGSEALVRVLNDTGATVTVTVVVRDLDAGETVVDETFDLPPAPDDDLDEGSRVYDDRIANGTTYEVTVSVAGGPSATGEYDGGVGRFWAVIEADGISFRNVT